MPSSIAIVRLLADRLPLAPSECTGDLYCVLCSVDFCDGDLSVPTNHDTDCPWRQAKEWTGG